MTETPAPTAETVTTFRVRNLDWHETSYACSRRCADGAQRRAVGSTPAHRGAIWDRVEVRIEDVAGKTCFCGAPIVDVEVVR